MNKKLIIVGGASGVGKNTLICMLKERIPMYYYKRRDAFFDFARQKKIPEEEVFEKISSQQADRYFVSECMKHNITITDVHYAIQVNRDRRFYKNDYYSMSIHEKYVDVFQDYFWDMTKDLDIMFILLVTDIQTIIQRNVHREKETRRKGRCVSYEDVKMQVIHEEKAWKRISESKNVEKLLVDASRFDIEYIFSKILAFIK